MSQQKVPVSAAQAAELVAGIAGRGLIIGDERVTQSSGGVHQHHNPSTGELQAEVVLAGPAEVDLAVAAARAALPVWRGTPMHKRIEILVRLADLLTEHRRQAAAVSALDNGTPVSTMDPGNYAAVWTRYYAGWIDKLEGSVVPMYGSDGLDYIVPEPYGVVATIVPWNGPMMGMGHKAIPAMAAGNTVVAKPPELAPYGAMMCAELALEAGLPPGVLNVITGGAEAGDALVRHPGVDKITFTGGASTARSVIRAAADSLTPMALELGGKSANIVFPDADLGLATSVAAMLGAVLLSGQGCALPTRLFAHDDVYDEVVERVVAQVESAVIGDALDPSVIMGPVVSEPACERILGVIDEARASGAGQVVTGGRRLEGDLADGYFVAPTVFAEVDPSSSLAQREVFGPVLSVLRFSGEDEVVELANGTPYGLAAYLYTGDMTRAQRVARALQAGTVTVNAFPSMSPTAPFGGVKQSGFGREGGRAGIDEFLQSKNIVIGG